MVNAEFAYLLHAGVNRYANLSKFEANPFFRPLNRNVAI